jgi:hypothetical protein
LLLESSPRFDPQRLGICGDQRAPREVAGGLRAKEVKRRAIVRLCRFPLGRPEPESVSRPVDRDLRAPRAATTVSLAGNTQEPAALVFEAFG